MATRGIGMTIQYVAWDTSANVGKTGDAGNHTLRWVKDGSAAAATNTPAEVDAVHAPGVYKLTLTSGETDANVGTLCGTSSTANVALIPISITFEHLPDAAPGSSGGLPTVDTDNYVAGLQGTKHTLDDLNDITGAGLSTFDASADTVNVGAVAGGIVSGVGDFKADLSGLSTFDPLADGVIVSSLSAAGVASLFTVDSGEAFADAVDGSAVKETASGAAAADWSSTERAQIRSRLGIDGSTSTPTATGDLDDIKAVIQAGR